MKRGQLSLEEAEVALDDFQKRLPVRPRGDPSVGAGHRGRWPRPRRRPSGCCPTSRPASTARGGRPRLRHACPRSPTTFQVHPKLLKQFEARDKMFDGRRGRLGARPRRWRTARSSLEGTDLRIAGQDTRRGTFSHRHAVLIDHTNGDEYAPLAHLGPDQGKFWIYDSLLSEYAALGFEYGYSVVAKESLVVWEAQFGDFWNGASTIVDQFLVAAEDKWDQTSGLVMYLPHGYEGQGPEHSSARVERFLTLCAEDNIQIANVTQAGAALPPAPPPGAPHRAQAARASSPRSPCCGPRSMRSPVDDLLSGSFQEILDDAGVRRPGRRAPHRARPRGKVGPGGHRRPRRGRGARRGGAGRAAVPVALRPARRDRRPVPGRHGARVAPGGAREHGRVELRQGPPLRALRRAPTRSGASRGTSRAAPPAARTPSTCRSRPSSSTAAVDRPADGAVSTVDQPQREADDRLELGEGDRRGRRP